MRRFVVIGRKASASPDFLLDDLPGTSGRLDVLARCLRAGLLFSHGVRRDAVVYLVLGGGPRAPRTVKIAGESAKFLRPDERSLAVFLKKCLERARPGVEVLEGGLPAVLADLGPHTPYILEEGGPDVREVRLAPDSAFFIGDHEGFAEEDRAVLASAATLSVGPVSIHADDVVAVLTNELDRR